jgi:hypothetical protein
MFLCSIASRPALGPSQPPNRCVPRAVSRGVNQPGRESDHTPPSNYEVKNEWRYTSTPLHAFME